MQAPVFLILLALSDGDAHGYRIRQAVIERSQGHVTLDPGSLYRLIARMEEDGLIGEVTAIADPDRADERRRYYGLTKRGRSALLAETDRLAELVKAARATIGTSRTRHA